MSSISTPCLRIIHVKHCCFVSAHLLHPVKQHKHTGCGRMRCQRHNLVCHFWSTLIVVDRDPQQWRCYTLENKEAEQHNTICVCVCVCVLSLSITSTPACLLCPNVFTPCSIFAHFTQQSFLKKTNKKKNLFKCCKFCTNCVPEHEHGLSRRPRSLNSDIPSGLHLQLWSLLLFWCDCSQWPCPSASLVSLMQLLSIQLLTTSSAGPGPTTGTTWQGSSADTSILGTCMNHDCVRLKMIHFLCLVLKDHFQSCVVFNEKPELHFLYHVVATHPAGLSTFRKAWMTKGNSYLTM